MQVKRRRSGEEEGLRGGGVERWRGATEEMCGGGSRREGNAERETWGENFKRGRTCMA